MAGNNPSPDRWAAARATVLTTIVIAILSLFAFAVRSSNTSPYPMPDLHKADSSEKRADNKNEESFWQNPTSDPVALFTFILTVFTAILAWSTYYLWKATQQLVIGAENTSERQLRAYVTLDRIMTNKVVNTDGQIVSIGFQPIFVNSGQTIARKVAYYSTIAYVIGDETPDAKFSTMPDELIISAIIGPSQTEVGPATAKIKSANFADLVRHHVVILVYGAISYTDVFENPRRTEFSTFFNAGDYSDASRDVVFTKTAEHNSADEDCMRNPYATATSLLRNPPKA